MSYAYSLQSLEAPLGTLDSASICATNSISSKEVGTAALMFSATAFAPTRDRISEENQSGLSQRKSCCFVDTHHTAGCLQMAVADRHQAHSHGSRP